MATLNPFAPPRNPFALSTGGRSSRASKGPFANIWDAPSSAPIGPKTFKDPFSKTGGVKAPRVSTGRSRNIGGVSTRSLTSAHLGRSPYKGGLYPSTRSSSTHSSSDPFHTLTGGGTSTKSNPFGSMAGKGYAPAATPPAPKKSSSPSGIEGFFSNLLGDAVSTARGIPTGFVKLGAPIFNSETQLLKAGFHGITGNETAALHDLGGIGKQAKNEWGNVKTMAKATANDWAPLLHGHYSQWAHNFYSHPLGPILDVGSLVTGGAGLAGRIARGASEAGALGRGAAAAADVGRTAKVLDKIGVRASEGSKIDRLGKFSKPQGMTYTHSNEKFPVKTDFKFTSGNPLTKAMQLKMHGALDKLPAHTSFLGSDARYMRGVVRKTAPRAVAAAQYDNKAVKLTDKQFGKGTAAEVYPHMLATAARRLLGPDKIKWFESVYKHAHDQFITHGIPHEGPLPGTSKAGKLSRSAPHRYILDQAKLPAKAAKDLYKHNPKLSFEEQLKGDANGAHGLADRLTTVNMKYAKQDAQGRYLYAPSHDLRKYGIEAHNATGFLKALGKGQAVWKHLLIGGSPKSVVNNSLGNAFFYLATHHGPTAFRSLVQGMTHNFGERKVISDLVKTGMTKDAARGERFLNPHFIDKHFGDQINAGGFAAAQAGLSHIAGKLPGYKLIHTIADQPFRRATIIDYLKKQPEVKALMRQDKRGFNDAAMKALDHPLVGHELRARTTNHVNDVMGDYHSLNPLERKVAAIMPFYTWNRHALRFAKTMTRDNPAVARGVAATGQEGAKTRDKLLGNLPSWMQASIPGSMLGLKNDKGRTALLNASGLDPLSTVADALAGSAAGIDALTGTHLTKETPGETIGGQLNPILASLIQHLTGTNMASGAPIKGGSALKDAFGNLPLINLAQAFSHGTPQPKPTSSGKPGKPFLYEKNPHQYLDSFLGLPIKQTDMKVAHSYANKEQGIKPPRQPRTSKKYRGL